MTWLDERLFGWSPSARRGTSAWSGSHHGDETSRMPTPEGSEDEDAGDYDNVVGIVDEHHSVAKTRSRNSSYADLQRLRMQALTPATKATTATEAVSTAIADNDDSNIANRHTTGGHRARRPSLSDGVPVQRIAEVDRAEPFSEATQDLNEEISHSKKA